MNVVRFDWLLWNTFLYFETWPLNQGHMITIIIEFHSVTNITSELVPSVTLIRFITSALISKTVTQDTFKSIDSPYTLEAFTSKLNFEILTILSRVWLIIVRRKGFRCKRIMVVHESKTNVLYRRVNPMKQG